jgi:tetratricopeptide (TPR) repeat protein
MDKEHLEKEETLTLREQINLRVTGADEVSQLAAAGEDVSSSKDASPCEDASASGDSSSSGDSSPSEDTSPLLLSPGAEAPLLSPSTQSTPLHTEHDPPAIRSKWAGQAQAGSSDDQKHQKQQKRRNKDWRNRHIALLIVVACLLSIFAAAKDYPLESLKVLVDNGNARLAVKFYNLTFRSDPRYQTFLINWSEKRRQENNYDDAAFLMTEAIKLLPTKSSCYLQRGNDNFFLSRTSEALADYNKAIELDPTNAAAYNNRGCILLRDLQLQAASTSLEKAVLLGPKQSLYWLNLGDCYFLQADYDKAMSKYEEAIILGDERGWFQSYLCEDKGFYFPDSFRLKIDNEMRPRHYPRGYDKGIIDTNVQD